MYNSKKTKKHIKNRYANYYLNEKEFCKIIDFYCELDNSYRKKYENIILSKDKEIISLKKEIISLKKEIINLKKK